MTILLGTYGIKSAPFCLYTYNSYHYYCLQDIRVLFGTDTHHHQMQHIFKANSNDFIKNKHTGHIFIMARTVISIARLWGSYCLAELCKLTLNEILAHVAEPLLNTIQYDNWQSASHHTVIVERDLIFESLYNDDWIFEANGTSNHPGTSTMSTSSSSSSSTLPPSLPIPSSPTIALLYKWISSNVIYEKYHTSVLKSCARVRKQQEAIIETRQRQIAFHTKSTTINASGKKMLLKKKNNAGTIQKRTSLPPSPPPQPKKRKSMLVIETNPKRKKKQQQQQQHRYHHRQQRQEYHQYVLEHGNDNLNLLATQATQMRGLPISPEISPSPPSLLYQQQQKRPRQRLPSLQTMLSELKQHI